MTTRIFSELGISPDLLKAITKLGFEQASPIQAAAIPVLMQGLDAVGQAQTGSGKTAAFGVPAIEKVDVRVRAVQALILCPTRELAVQVCEEIHKLAFFKRGIHALPIYGGQSYDRQLSGLRQGAQIVIGTPGRIMDHMRRGTLQLNLVKFVVLDEADVMLDMGFRDDIEFILQAVPTTRQTVFFSATMPRPIQDLIQRYARDPRILHMEDKTLTVSTTEQMYYEVDRRFKIELLTRLIDIHDLRLGIIFCNTKRMVDDLADHLNVQGYSADRLHGDMTQAMRDRVMNKFRKSGLEFLVATDVAARGIDVNDVQVVFNYDLPYDAEDYVHRIGRTGRAGRTGLAISFVAGRELFQIQHIERFTKMRIQRGRIPTQVEVDEARASVFMDKVRATLQSGEYKRQDSLIERLLEEGFTSTDIASALIHHLQNPDAAPGAVPQQKESRGDNRSNEESRGGWGRQESNDRQSRARDDRQDRPYAPRSAPAPTRFAAPRKDPVVAQAKATSESKPALISAPKPAPAVVSKPAATAPKLTPSAAPSGAPVPAKSAAASKPASIATPKSAPKLTPAVALASPSPTPEPIAVPRPAAELPAPQPTEKTERPAQVETPDGVAKSKGSRRTPEEQTRIHVNVGQEMGITSSDIVSSILGETGLPASNVGTVDVRERHLFVDVATEHVNAIIAKLNRAQIKGRRLKVKLV